MDNQQIEFYIPVNSKNTNAKCEECGDVFIMGITGLTRNGHDVCDLCNHTVRDQSGNVVNDPWFEWLRRTDHDLR